MAPSLKDTIAKLEKAVDKRTGRKSATPSEGFGGAPVAGTVAEAVAAGSKDYFGEVREEERKTKAKVKKAEEHRKAKILAGHLKENEILLTDMTGGELPASGINHVIPVYPDSEWHLDDMGFIKKKDPFYVFDPDDVEIMHLARKTGERLLFHGHPGTGKTSAGEQFSAWINQPYLQFNGKDDLESDAFLGKTGIREGETLWFDGAVTEGCKKGFYVCIDEVMKIHPGIQMAMQTLYQRDGFLLLDAKEGGYADKLVQPKGSFFLLLTDNVLGGGEDMDMYPSTNIQDSSFIDRIGLKRKKNYLPKSKEVPLLINKYQATEKDADVLVRFANMIRNGYDKREIRVTLSARGLGSICRIMQEGLPMNYAINMCYTAGISDPTQRQVITAKMEAVGLKR